MTDKQFRAVAHELLIELNRTPGTGSDNASFLTGALMAMFDIGASSVVRDELRPDGRGRNFVNGIVGRWA